MGTHVNTVFHFQCSVAEYRRVCASLESSTYACSSIRSVTFVASAHAPRYQLLMWKTGLTLMNDDIPIIVLLGLGCSVLQYENKLVRFDKLRTLNFFSSFSTDYSVFSITSSRQSQLSLRLGFRYCHIRRKVKAEITSVMMLKL